MNSLYESDIEKLGIEQLHPLGWECLQEFEIALREEREFNLQFIFLVKLNG